MSDEELRRETYEVYFQILSCRALQESEKIVVLVVESLLSNFARKLAERTNQKLDEDRSKSNFKSSRHTNNVQLTVPHLQILGFPGVGTIATVSSYHSCSVC